MMNKKTFIFLTFLFAAFNLFSQGEVEALKYSRKELNGTARSVAMGGAFGALGGDISGISINPAGIGVYRSSEIVGTFGLQSTVSKVGDIKNTASDFNLNNFGFVGYFPLRSETVPMINFGFAQNRQKNFKRQMGAFGEAYSTMTDYIAERSYGIKPSGLKIDKNLPDPFFSQPWLSVLGYNSKLIYPHEESNGDYYYTPLNTNNHAAVQEIKSYESGYIDNYDFTVGTTINNVLNIGLSVNVTDMYHYLSTEFLEDYDNGNGRYDNGGYTLGNKITTTGSGIGAKFGLIYRPIHELRVGLAYHTPVLYSLTESYEAFLDDDMGAYVTDSEYEKGTTYSALFTNYYDLKTPSKWVLSAATVLGNNFIFSADYELTNYKDMKLKVPSGYSNSDFYDYDNEYIDQDFKMASTLRLGAEYRVTQQLSARLGYAWIQNPYNSDFVDDGNAMVSGSNTIYRMEGDTNYFTGGIGYRFNRSFYMDFAMVYQTQNDQLYPFPNVYGDTFIDAAPFDMKSNSLRGLITLGYKF